ncbi:MAG: hypothetical protein Q9186_005264 [Xanthomendoza sp. 1 TL-2023]
MSDQITLFDLASKPPSKSWSPNPWKVRLLLNYKSIPYQTHFLEWPNITPHLSSLSIPPNTPTDANPTPLPYTVPTIRLPADKGGAYIMDSKLIAAELENLYPNPPLVLNTAEEQILEALAPKFMQIMGATLAPKVAGNILGEESKGYLIAQREKASGLKFAEKGEEEEEEEKAWEDVVPLVREMGQVLRSKKDEEGPFILGKEVSFADFVLVGWMVFLRRCGEGVWERFVGIEPGFGRLWEGCLGWVEGAM